MIEDFQPCSRIVLFDSSIRGIKIQCQQYPEFSRTLLLDSFISYLFPGAGLAFRLVACAAVIMSPRYLLIIRDDSLFFQYVFR